MDILHIFAILITLTAVFSYLNHRFIGLPVTIGVMLAALLMSLLLQLLSGLGIDIERPVARLLQSIDFNKTVLEGMLSFLLFAGALHVNINDLSEQKGSIGLLATFAIAVAVKKGSNSKKHLLTLALYQYCIGDSAMTIEQMSEFFGWCTILNIAMLAIAAAIVI